jgi:peptidoglycan hydrolase-like protein with peptidoglycan-binding domain
MGCDDEEDGLSLLGVDAIPTAGATYSDAKTVAAVQSALVGKGYDLGTSGPNGDGVDGLFGSKTKAAIKKLQTDLGADATGKIDSVVLSALKVTPGVLPPGVSIQDQAAVQAQVALDAATAAEHAQTPSDVQAAAQAAVNAAPAQPPQLKQAAQAALAKAKAAKTPADIKAAAGAVQDAAMDVHSAVKPSWFVIPAWEGGPPRWQMLAAGGGALVGLIALIVGLSSGGSKGSDMHHVRARIDKWRASKGLPAHKWSD